MLFLMSIGLATCPVAPPALQTLSDDGAAWQIYSDGATTCLFRTDDLDDSTLIKSWEGPPPRVLIPLAEGVVAASDRWLLLTDGLDRWRLSLRLPEMPAQACFHREDGRLVLLIASQLWVIQISDGSVLERRTGGLGCG